MEKKEKYQFEEALESISKVQVSPFILTRIQERIKQNDVASTPFVWAIGLSFMLILAVNIVGFVNYNDANNNLSSNAVEVFDDLLPQNSLYD